MEEEKLINDLKDIGYTGPLIPKSTLCSALKEGPKNIEFTKVVHHLTNELRTLCNIDEQVNIINDPNDSNHFIMEITSFLKELNCPYKNLIEGSISDRLQNVNDCLLLISYLISELMGARIIKELKPDKKIELHLKETDVAANLRKILMTLRLSKPPSNISIQVLFNKLTPTVEKVVKTAPDLIGKSAFNGFLSDKQWDILSNLQQDFNEEYKIRREMLLTRLDVTIQSFRWSEKTKGKSDLFQKVFTEKRELLECTPNVDIADLLAARDDITIIEKTSNSSVRKNTQSKLNKIIIGQVPDRGGRTSEQAPPPPEMPSWQQRTVEQSSSSHRGGQGGYSRGAGGGGGGGGYGYSRGGGSYGQSRGDYSNSYNNNTTSGTKNFDSSGSYGNASGSYNNYDNNRGAGAYGYDQRNYSGDSGGYDDGRRRNYDNNKYFDSAGSYEQNSKRVKKFDNFQTNSRSTYTDQYIQENQNNQQYHGGYGGGRGKSNRSRGRGRNF